MSKRRQRPSTTAPAGGSATTLRDTALLRQARQLWNERRWDAALATFEKAVEAEPRNARGLIDAARAFGARYQFPRADELLRRLLEHNGSSASIVALAGQSYQLISRYPEAAECYARALRLAPRDPPAQLELARLYERLHRLEEADELVERVLKAKPSWPPALLAQAIVQRRLNRDADAETTLRKLTSAHVTDPDLLAAAWAELAQILDRRGDYDGAMEAIVFSKQQMLPRDGAERKTSEFVLGRFEKMFAELRPGDLHRWLEQSRDVASHPPLALLSGFPRSGTTLLEQVLDSHPGVISSEERDIMGFEVFPALIESVPDRSSVHDVLNRVGLELVAAEQHRYFAYNEGWLNEPIADRLLLDKNPGSTLLLPVFLRIFPQFRSLIALRDPRDVILSCFMLYLPLNPLSVNFLTLERAARRYALDMGSWLKLREMFPLPWLEVRYEDTVRDLPSQARRVLGFLGLPWDPAVLNYQQHAQTKTVLSPTYAAVTQPVHSRAIGRWRGYSDYLEPVLPILEPFVQAFGYR